MKTENSNPKSGAYLALEAEVLAMLATRELWMPKAKKPFPLAADVWQLHVMGHLFMAHAEVRRSGSFAQLRRNAKPGTWPEIEARLAKIYNLAKAEQAAAFIAAGREDMLSSMPSDLTASPARVTNS